jgi:hypothetical protein
MQCTIQFPNLPSSQPMITTIYPPLRVHAQHKFQLYGNIHPALACIHSPHQSSGSSRAFHVRDRTNIWSQNRQMAPGNAQGLTRLKHKQPNVRGYAHLAYMLSAVAATNGSLASTPMHGMHFGDPRRGVWWRLCSLAIKCPCRPPLLRVVHGQANSSNHKRSGKRNSQDSFTHGKEDVEVVLNMRHD